MHWVKKRLHKVTQKIKTGNYLAKVAGKCPECNDVLDDQRISFDNDAVIRDVQATEVMYTYAHVEIYSN